MQHRLNMQLNIFLLELLNFCSVQKRSNGDVMSARGHVTVTPWRGPRDPLEGSFVIYD